MREMWLEKSLTIAKYVRDKCAAFLVYLLTVQAASVIVAVECGPYSFNAAIVRGVIKIRSSVMITVSINLLHILTIWVDELGE